MAMVRTCPPGGNPPATRLASAGAQRNATVGPEPDSQPAHAPASSAGLQRLGRSGERRRDESSGGVGRPSRRGADRRRRVERGDQHRHPADVEHGVRAIDRRGQLRPRAVGRCRDIDGIHTTTTGSGSKARGSSIGRSRSYTVTPPRWDASDVVGVPFEPRRRPRGPPDRARRRQHPGRRRAGSPLLRRRPTRTAPLKPRPRLIGIVEHTHSVARAAQRAGTRRRPDDTRRDPRPGRRFARHPTSARGDRAPCRARRTPGPDSPTTPEHERSRHSSAPSVRRRTTATRAPASSVRAAWPSSIDGDAFDAVLESSAITRHHQAGGGVEQHDVAVRAVLALQHPAHDLGVLGGPPPTSSSGIAGANPSRPGRP